MQVGMCDGRCAGQREGGDVTKLRPFASSSLPRATPKPEPARDAIVITWMPATKDVDLPIERDARGEQLGSRREGLIFFSFRGQSRLGRACCCCEATELDTLVSKMAFRSSEGL